MVQRSWFDLKLIKVVQNCQNPSSTSIQPNITHHTTTTENSMSVISQLLLNQFWQNFKRRFLGPSWTDSICHEDIRPGNICPYQEYLSRYFSPNFKGRFLSQWYLSSHHLSWRYLPRSETSQLFVTKFWGNFMDPIFCRPQFFASKFLLYQHFVWLKLSWF